MNYGDAFSAFCLGLKNYPWKQLCAYLLKVLIISPFRQVHLVSQKESVTFSGGSLFLGNE